MRAAVLYGAHDFRIEDLPLPEISDEQCLVKVKACGVCHSEIHQWDEKISTLDYPRYIGHEVAGIIEKTGAKVQGFKKGDPVALWVDSKGYAEKIAVNSSQIFPLAAHIPFSQAMAEPLSCTTNAVMRTRVKAGETVALVGTGFMGLILLQQIRLSAPKKIIAVDVREEMLRNAKILGADITINPLKEDPEKKIQDYVGGEKADVVFEIGGTEKTLNLAANLCRMEGKLVIFGFHPGPRIISDLGYWNWMAFDIINAHFRDLGAILNGTRAGMEMLNSNKISLAPLITHTFSLVDINQAFVAAKDKPAGFVKAVIEFDN